MAKGGAIRWSEEQLAAHKAARKLAEDGCAAPSMLYARLGKPSTAPAAGPGADFYALGRVAKGKMNKTEAAYAQRLEAMKHSGQILDWKFHVLRVRLADATFYEPDFLVLTAEREIQIHEVKGGFTTDKGQMKVKLCAEVLPWFRVFKCSKKGGEWLIQEFSK